MKNINVEQGIVKEGIVIVRYKQREMNHDAIKTKKQQQYPMTSLLC